MPVENGLHQSSCDEIENECKPQGVVAQSGVKREINTEEYRHGTAIDTSICRVRVSPTNTPSQMNAAMPANGTDMLHHIYS